MSEPSNVLILWDVDGTLTSLVPEPLQFFARHLGALPISLGRLPEASSTHGRSEREIVTALMEMNMGVRPHEGLVTSALRLLQMRSPLMRSELQQLIRPLPGVKAGLRRLHGAGVAMTVITGNSFHAAFDKLRATRLDEFLDLPCGGYADEALGRAELINEVLQRAETWFGRSLSPSRVVYVGDTPMDVHAANRAGVASVALATGQFTREELTQADPAIVLRNLEVDGALFDGLIERLTYGRRR